MNHLCDDDLVSDGELEWYGMGGIGAGMAYPEPAFTESDICLI